MALDIIVQSVSEKTAKTLLVIVVSMLTVVAAFAYNLESSWRSRVTVGIQKNSDVNERQDVDIARLAVATENLRVTVERQTEFKQGFSEDRTKRLDRLLDVLEKQAYNASKEKK